MKGFVVDFGPRSGFALRRCLSRNRSVAFLSDSFIVCWRCETVRPLLCGLLGVTPLPLASFFYRPTTSDLWRGGMLHMINLFLFQTLFSHTRFRKLRFTYFFASHSRTSRCFVTLRFPLLASYEHHKHCICGITLDVTDTSRRFSTSPTAVKDSRVRQRAGW